MMHKEFLDFIFQKNGVVNGKRLNEEYFASQNKTELWNWFISLNHLMHISKLKYRARVIHLGYHNDIPKCYCGKPVTFSEGKLSQYCCAECAKKSDDKKMKMKEVYSLRTDTQRRTTNAKREATNIQKYGVAFHMQRPEIQEKAIKKLPQKLSSEILCKLNDKDYLHELHIGQQLTSTEIADLIGCSPSTAFNSLKNQLGEVQRFNTTSQQRGIVDFIRRFGVEVIVNDKTTGIELDVYIPEHNLAIELNGLFWHSHNPHIMPIKDTTKFKHQKKIEICKEYNIQLLQFTDHQWDNQSDIVKSIIASKLGKSSVIIGARKLSVEQVSNKEASSFFDSNHLQGGKVNGHVNIALKNHDGIIFCISVGKSRFKNKADWEILRMASKINVNIPGGFSKVLAFLSTATNVKGTLLSYADKCISTGNGYSACGFQYTGDTGPSYFWTDGNHIVSRYQAMKKNLPALLGENFDFALSEDVNMYNSGYRKFWLPGSLIYNKKI